MRKHWNSIPGKVLPHVNFFGELYRIVCGLLQVNLYTALTSMVTLIFVFDDLEKGPNQAECPMVPY